MALSPFGAVTATRAFWSSLKGFRRARQLCDDVTDMAGKDRN